MTRHAVITGAAEGIGRALAEVYLDHGYAVTGVDVNAELSAKTLNELSRQGRSVSFIQADLCSTADLKRLSEQLAEGPSIDVLAHNAGVNHIGAFAESDLAAQQTVLDVNLRAPLHLTSALLRARKILQGGSIIFISSLSYFVSYPGASVYAASKDGLASYARSLAAALASERIHVLTVFPGPTRTAHARRYSPDNSREAQRMAPETVAAAIYQATTRRQRLLIPGIGNRLFALAGRWAPGVTEGIMRKMLFEKLS